MVTIEIKEYTVTITEDKKPKVSSKKKPARKKLEFMQIVVLISLALPYAWVTCSYVLAWMEKPSTLESLSGYVVTVPIAAIIGYITQNSIRSASYNKMVSTIETKEITTDTVEDTMMKGRESRGA